jgi:drug/metabolite transporter (DMT)-like permease
LSRTSVAASVTLVCSSPILIALYLLAVGRPPGGRTLASIGVASTGVATILIGDALANAPVAGATTGSRLAGDGLALTGAALIAVYFVIGQHLRASLPTSVYAGWTYAFAALALAPLALAGGVGLDGFDRRTWLVVAATIAGPQLAGHTVLNALLKELGPVTVSLALLVEPFGSTALVWLLFNEVPPPLVAVGAPLVVAGLALHLAADRALALTPSTSPP